MAALVCRSPPLWLCWHALPFSIPVDTIGTTWNHVELLGFSWMCPTPSTWNVWLHWCAGPPLSYILFPCPGVCWHALPFSLQLDTSGTTRNHLKPSGNYTTLEPPGTYTTLGFSWMCPTPIVPETYGCTGVQVPPPFHTFFPTLGYFGMRRHSPYRWILLEPPKTMWNS